MGMEDSASFPLCLLGSVGLTILGAVLGELLFWRPVE
jgi:hypothetical protein